jgi:hypothetical protein
LPSFGSLAVLLVDQPGTRPLSIKNQPGTASMLSAVAFEIFVSPN